MLIKNYAYTVATYVPHDQRQEIQKNVEEDIYDQLEGLYPKGDYTEVDIENVLINMGDPRSVAKSYSDEERYLIGPTYLPLYQNVLKIVIYTLISAFIGIGVIQLLTSKTNIGHVVSDVVTNIGINGLIGAAIVTFIFAMLERKDNNWLGEKADQTWHISQLKKAPEQKNTLKRSDVIGSLVAEIMTLVILNQMSEYIGIGFIGNGEIDFYPLISLQAIHSLLPLVNGVLLIGIGFNMVLIAKQEWTKHLRLFAIAFEIISLLLWIRIITYPHLINTAFLEAALGSDAYNHLMAVSQYNIAIGIVILLFISAYAVFKHLKALKIK